MITIRPASISDALAISSLIDDVKHFFTVKQNGEGAEDFLKSISPEAIASYIVDERYNYFVAIVDQDLAGVVAVRDNAHLFHLFVASRFQRRRIAAQMWRFARANAMEYGSLGEFTVNSTLHAVKVYESFGFRVTGERVEKHGIAYVPMQLEQRRYESQRMSLRMPDFSERHDTTCPPM
jgi:ribosomal protein S18 acetylase RimI-like enzyme